MKLAPTMLICLALAVPASAAPVSISTGVAPWQVNGNPAVAEDAPLPSTWLPGFGDGVWIGTSAADSNAIAGGTYVFTLNIGAFVGAAGTFSLDYAGDNSVEWTITNGTLAGTSSCPIEYCFMSPSFAPANITPAPRSLTGTFAASSVLTATIVNWPGGGPNPMGLLVVGTADARRVTAPEPATMGLLGLGALAAVARRRRN